MGAKKKQDEEISKKADKANRKETEKQQASAANAAAAAAFGSKAAKWGAWSTEPAMKPVSKLAKAGTSKADGAAAMPTASAAETKNSSTFRAPGESMKGPALPPSRVKAEMLSAKLPDLVAVLERDPMYQKSALLYRLHDLD